MQITFLEKHGGTLNPCPHRQNNLAERTYSGISGSLRPIPVSPIRDVSSLSGDASLRLPRRPGVSQTLLDLLASSTKSNDTQLDTDESDRLPAASAANTLDFIPAPGKQRSDVTLLGAPVKKEATYRTPVHLPVTPQSQPVERQDRTESDNHDHPTNRSATASDFTLNTNGSGDSEQKPTYATVASNFGLSPEVVEKIVRTEKLFTPIRVSSEAKQDPSFASDVSNLSENSSANTTTTDISQSGQDEAATKTEENISSTPLMRISEELGVSPDLIKAIVKRLGALI